MTAAVASPTSSVLAVLRPGVRIEVVLHGRRCGKPLARTVLTVADVAPCTDVAHGDCALVTWAGSPRPSHVDSSMLRSRAGLPAVEVPWISLPGERVPAVTS